jgi:hypothetical protein
MITPILILLFLGMVEFARLGWIYYTAQKILFTAARMIGTQQGVNFCLGDGDEQILRAKNFALTGSNDGSGEGLLPNLQPSSIEIRQERLDRSSGVLAQCDCDATGCDPSQGGQPPDYITARYPDGVSVQLRIPFLPGDPIILRPQVRLPYGGT